MKSDLVRFVGLHLRERTSRRAGFGTGVVHEPDGESVRGDLSPVSDPEAIAESLTP
jgi:hypothetical protein